MSRAFGFMTYGGPETQEFLDRPVPVPGPGELLIDVRVAGVNPADWKTRRGLFGTTGRELPAVLGSEVAGVVRAVGPGVTGYAVGDEVFGLTRAGGYAEQTLLSAENTARKPEQISFAQAAVLPVAATAAYDGVEQLDLRPGQTLVILGISGGVGSVAAQIARERGLTVLGTASDANRAYLADLGATQVRYGEGVADRLRAAAPGGVDGLLDLIGGGELRAAAVVLNDPAKLVSTADRSTAEDLGGSYLQRSRLGATLAALAGLVAAGRLDPQIVGSYPLRHAAQALAEVESGHARGKIVLEVS